MRYLIAIRVDSKSSTFRIDAKTEEEAIERLKLRLPPAKRESFDIDSIAIDPSSHIGDEPFGIYCD